MVSLCENEVDFFLSIEKEKSALSYGRLKQKVL